MPHSPILPPLLTAKRRVSKFYEMNLSKGEMAIDYGRKIEKMVLRQEWKTPWEMLTTGPGSEPDNEEELGDDDAPDW